MPRGVYIRTEYHRKIISESHKGLTGLVQTNETRKKISERLMGNTNGKSNKGKKHSEKWKIKNGESHRGMIPWNKGKGHLYSEEWKRKQGEFRKGLSSPMKGKQHSEESKRKMSNATIGCKNIHWKGGRSRLPYCYKFNERRKSAVRKFFRGYCIITGEQQNDSTQKLCVHHVDHDKEQGCNGKSFNLIPMIRTQHNKEKYNEEEYKSYINKTLREGFKWGIWNEQEYIENVMYDE
jgi:hypothetical protein